MSYRKLRRKVIGGYNRVRKNKNLKAIYKDAKSLFGPTIKREIKRAKRSNRSNDLFQPIDF